MQNLKRKRSCKHVLPLHAFLLAFIFAFYSLIDTAIAELAKCYDSNVLNYYYSLTIPVEDAQVTFTVPGSYRTDDAQVRLFGEPWPWERKNLWDRETRNERYQEALLEIVTLANYAPERIRAFQKGFLDKAPLPIRNSPLYDLLSQWVGNSVNADQNLSTLKNNFNSIVDITELITHLADLSDLYVANAPPQPVDIFANTSFAVYQSPGAWTTVREWVKPIADAAKKFEEFAAAANLVADTQEILVTTFWMSLMSNDAALERLYEIKNQLNDSLLWQDPAFQDAIATIEEYLQEVKTKQTIELLIDNIADHLPELVQNSLTVAGVELGGVAINIVNQGLTNAGFSQMSFAAAGNWSIGVAALQYEFKVFLGIVRQLENSELSVVSSTIAQNLCMQTESSCGLKVPAMYGYFASAKFVIEAFNWEPVPFWNLFTNWDETINLWEDAATYMLSNLDYEFFNPCDFEPPSVSIVTPTENSTYGGTILIQVDAFDNVRVDEVEFYYSSDGNIWYSIGIDSNDSDGWSYSYDSSAIDFDTTFWFSVEARDAANPVNTSPREGISVTIDNRTQLPNLYVTTTSLVFDSVLIGQTARHSFNVKNTGNSQMAWSATASEGWMILSMESWLFDPGEERTIYVTANTNGLAGDITYSGTISNVTDAGNIDISVTLKTVSAPAEGGTITLNPQEDAHIMQQYPDSTYNQTSLICRKFSGWDYAALIKFDLSSLTGDNVVIRGATLDLYCNYYNNDDNDPQDLSVYRSTKDWSETSVTWTSNGIYYGYESDKIDLDGTGWVRDIDVRSHVSNWLSSGNYGLLIRYPNPSNGNKNIHFDSLVAAKPPELHVEYVIKDGVIPNLSISQPSNQQLFNSPNITVSGTAYDANGLDYIQVRLNGGNWVDANGLENWSLNVNLQEGDNSIEVKAKDNTAESRTLSINVRYDKPDFKLNCYPPSILVKQGKAVSTSVFLSSLNDFNSVVSLSVTGQPAGISIDFDESQISPPKSTSVTFTASNDVSIGTYSVSVVGQSSGITKSQVVNLIVQDGITPTAEITSPTSDPSFETNQKSISIQGNATDSGAGVLAVMINTGETNGGNLQNWSFNVELSDGYNVFRITAIDGQNNQASDTITIRYVPPPPDIVSGQQPTNGAIDIPINSQMSWAASTNATSYAVYLGTSIVDVSNATPDFATIYHGTQKSLTFSPGMLTGELTYYWRIDAVNSAGSTKGNVLQFTTSAPLLIGDSNNDFMVDIFDLGFVSMYFGRSVADELQPPWTSVGSGESPDIADINNDGTVDSNDLDIVSSHFGEIYP